MEGKTLPERGQPMTLRDDNGNTIRAGDIVIFSYGIPPVRVRSRIIERDGRLIGLCPGHNPPDFNLRSLRKYVGNWYKYNI